MLDLSEVTVTNLKPLPVFLLLDTSYSMDGRKIEELNRATREMLETFKEEERKDNSITVAVITFGGEAKIHLDPTRASEINWKDLSADGNTPMGKALEIAKSMVEDKEVTPGRAYRPIIVLVSDGQPNDQWENPLCEFVKEGRSAKCDRMAMAIGSDADRTVLEEFLEGTSHQLCFAKNASQLHEFFQRVTMSVTMRSNSTDPNELPEDSVLKLDGTIAKASPVSQGGDDDSDDWE